jgi:excinuclease ABC subunit A
LKDKIFVKGARQHNLKNIDVEIPRDKLVVITGLSGREVVARLRHHLRRGPAPLRRVAVRLRPPVPWSDGQAGVDYIEGLSPAISIDQKTTSRNPRSTVGTVTEIYDYLRLLFARAGRPHCPQCGKPIAQQTVEQMVDQILTLPEGTRLSVLAPVIHGKKGEHQKVLDDIRKDGYARVRVDGEVLEINAEIKPEKTKKHNIDVVVDRIAIRDGIAPRLADSIETALKLAEGLVVIDVVGGKELIFSQNFACSDCGVSLPEIAPRMFSFNNPYGACRVCTVWATTWRSTGAGGADGSYSFLDGRSPPFPQHQLVFMCTVGGAARNARIFAVQRVGRLPPTSQTELWGAGEEQITLEYENLRGYGACTHPLRGRLPIWPPLQGMGSTGRR